MNKWNSCDVLKPAFGLFHCRFFLIRKKFLAKSKTSRHPPSNMASEKSTPNAKGIPGVIFLVYWSKRVK